MSRKKRVNARPPAANRQARPQTATRMLRRGVAVLGVVLVTLLLLRGKSGATAAVGVPQEGQPVPELKVTTLSGERVVLSELRGQVVLVNFWATWCPPCRAEMPGFQRVWEEKGKAGLVVVGLAADETGSRGVAAFVRDHGIGYPVAMAGAAVQRSFGGVNALPVSFLVDRSGVIDRKVTGVYEEGLLRRDVNRLLGRP